MPLEIKVPAVGESITEVTIATWLKKDGEHVEADDVLCEIESDKATFELNAESAGTLHVKAQEGDTVKVGDIIASIDEAGGKKPAAESTQPEADKKQEATEQPQAKQALKQEQKTNYASGTPSPAAAKIMAEKNVSPEQVQGSGKDGRITKEDAMTQSSPQSQPAPNGQLQPAAKPATPAPAAAPRVAGSRNTHKEKMSALRKTIAKRLVEVKNTTAMLTTFNEIDMSAIMEMRKKYKDAFKEKHQVGLGFMSLFAKAVCEALKEFPAVNAQIQETDVLYNEFVDLGIAVSTPRGLVVPVIRNAESMSLAEIEKSVMDLAVRARDNKLTIEEMTGGTFTITNGGVFGSLLSTPILNAPQSAILGMHNIVERPIALNGQVVIRPMMYVALSYDHRIIDGRESVSFLVRVKQMLEDPNRMLLEV
jgi:2-oxoglutarate dehydrogenase E2 component (dihydrolipoamide succinyltransferase)